MRPQNKNLRPNRDKLPLASKSQALINRSRLLNKHLRDLLFESLGRLEDPVAFFDRLREEHPEDFARALISLEPKLMTVISEPAPQLGEGAKRVIAAVTQDGKLSAPALLEALRDGNGNGREPRDRI